MHSWKKWSTSVKKLLPVLPKLKLYITILLCLLFINSFGQEPENDSIKINKTKLIGVSAFGAIAYGGGMTGLYQLWYKDYDQSGIHIINDNNAWLQVDKIGHSFSGYQMSRVAFTGFHWAGVNNKKAAIIGTAYGLGVLTTIELFDGLSTNWGWSWSDVGANFAGAGLFLGQQLIWKEQRIQMKFSYYPSQYAKYNPSLLGQNGTESFFKDYNAQTYWLSINPQSFFSSRKVFPSWLNIAIGYGAKGMTGTFSNSQELDGTSLPHFQRTRQYYLSLDIDLSRIKTKSEFLRIILSSLNMIKIPMPGLEYNQQNGFLFHRIYF